MKTFYLFNIAILFSITSVAQELENLWLKRVGSTVSVSNPFSDVFSSGVATDQNNFVYAIGDYRNTIDADADIAALNLTSNLSRRMYITKRNEQGTLLWAKQIGSDTSTVFAKAVSTDINGDVIIAGEVGNVTDLDPGAGEQVIGGAINTVFILKLDADGEFIWVKTFESFEGGTCTIKTIKTDDAGNIYTLGQHVDAIDFDPGEETYVLDAPNEWTGNATYITKLNQAGELVWARHTEYVEFGGFVSIFPEDFDIDNDGDIIVCGHTTGSVDFDPGSGVATYPILASGMFIWQLNSDGNYVWSTTIYGTENQNFGRGIETSENGAIYISGSFRGTTDFDPSPADFSLTSTSNSSDCFIMKLNESHDLQWIKTWGSPADDFGSSIALDNNENIYSTGYFQQTADFNPSSETFNLSTAGNHALFIQNLDADGNFMFAAQYSGPTTNLGNNAFIYSIDCDNNNNVYLSGNFNQTMNFGGSQQTLNAGDDYDAFLLKLGENTIDIAEHISTDGLLIYPNPASDAINVQLNITDVATISYEVKDITGKSVLKSQKASSSNFSIQLHDLTNGCYILRIKDKDNSISRTFFKL